MRLAYRLRLFSSSPAVLFANVYDTVVLVAFINPSRLPRVMAASLRGNWRNDEILVNDSNVAAGASCMHAGNTTDASCSTAVNEFSTSERNNSIKEQFECSWSHHNSAWQRRIRSGALSINRVGGRWLDERRWRNRGH